MCRKIHTVRKANIGLLRRLGIYFSRYLKLRYEKTLPNIQIIMSTINLPGFLFDTYASYKTGTTALVQWLSTHSGKGRGQAHIGCARDLIYLTRIVVKKHIKVPDDLLQTLRKTIRARTRVANFFKRLAASEEHSTTASHEFFTSVLQQVHDDLRGLAEGAQEKVVTLECGPAKPNNAFEHLQTEDCPECEDESSHEGCKMHARGLSRKGRQKKPPKAGNDFVNEFMALSTYLLVSCAFCPRSWKDGWNMV